MKRKGRLVKAVKRRVDRQPEATQAAWRWLAWLAQHEFLFVLAGAAVFALATMASHRLSAFESAQSFLKVFSVLWVVGVFLFIVVVTDDNRKYARTATKTQAVSGAIAGAGIALALGAPWHGIAVGLMVGAFLGLFAKHWVYSL